MNDMDNAKELITLVGVVASLGGAWFLVRYQVGELRKAMDKTVKENARQWVKLDDVHSRLMVFENRLKVISTILQPEKVAEHTEKTATIVADVKYLRRDVDELRSKT